MFEAIKCINATETLCADFFFGLLTNKDPQTIKIHPVDPTTCWNMANNETYAAQLNITKHADTIWTSATNVSMSRGFIGQKCQSVQQYAVQRGSIGSSDGRHIVSDILGPNNCDIHNLTCTDETGAVVWNISSEAVFCSHRSRGIYNTAIVKTETTQHLLVPYSQSSFTLAPGQPIPSAVRKCIPGAVIAAGNDAYIRFLPLPAATATTPAVRQKRAIQWLKLPEKTSTTEPTAEQKLLAIQRKLWALREILSIPPAEALFNPDINRLANNRQRKRTERLRNMQMWRKRLSELENLQKKAQHHRELPRNEVPEAPTQTPAADRTTSPSRRIATTTEKTTASEPATAVFPYVQPRTVLVKRARNGAIYYESSARKKYALSQLPHGSVVWNRTSDELQYVFWQTPDQNAVRLYRHLRWEYAEDRRDGPRFIPTRSTRHNMDEAKLLRAIGQREFLSSAEGQNFAQLGDEIGQRQRLDEVISQMFAGKMADDEDFPPLPTYNEQKKPKISTYLEDEGFEREYDNYEYKSSESEEPTDGRRRRHAKTSEEFDYGADDAQDKEHKKQLARRFEKDAERHEHSGLPNWQRAEATTRAPDNPYPEDTEQLSYSLNEKIQFADDEWNVHNARVFRQVYTAICESHNQDLRIIRSLAKFDASTALQTWFRRTDIVAVQAGQALALYVCTPVVPENVYWSQQLQNTCYAEVPVAVNGTIWYLQHGTNDLKRYSREIPCSQRRPNIYHNGSSWISSTGHRQHVAKLSHHIHFEKPELEIDLKGRSLYESDIAEVLTSASMLAGYDRRMNRLEDTFVSIQLRTATPIMDTIASAVDDAMQALNQTLSNAKQTLSGWDPFAWITAWYHYAIIVITICGVIAGVIGCWYAAPFILACTTPLREALRARRQTNKFRRERRRASTHNTEMHQIIAAVHAEEPFPQPKADVKLYEFYPSFALMTVATRHHQREAGVQPSLVVKTRGSDTTILLDTGDYCSTSKKELQYMMTPITKRMTTSLFIHLPTGHQVAAPEQYDVQIPVEGKNLPFSLLVPDADSNVANTIIFGCDAISTLNAALGSLKMQFQPSERSWRLQFVETESISETRAVASCYRLNTAKASDRVTQSMQQGWSALHIAAYINSRPSIGRVDTGSLVSLCKLTTAFKCHLERQETDEAMPQLRFLGNNCIEPIGRAYAIISIGPYRHRVLIYVVRDDSIPYEHSDFVLGDDLLNAIAREYTIFLNLPKREFKVSGLNVAVDDTGHATLYQHSEDRRSVQQREVEVEEIRQLRSDNETMKQKLADARKQREAEVDRAERHRLERKELIAKADAAAERVKDIKQRYEERQSKEVSASEQLIAENRALRRTKDEYWADLVNVRNQNTELLQHCPSALENINVTKKLRDAHAEEVKKLRADAIYWKTKYDCRPERIKKIEEANAQCTKEIADQLTQLKEKEDKLQRQNGLIVDLRNKLVEVKTQLQDAIQADLDSYDSDTEAPTPKQKVAKSSKALLDRIETLLDETADIRKPTPKAAGIPAKKPRQSHREHGDDDHRVCAVAPSKQMEGATSRAAKTANGSSISYLGSIKLPVILKKSKIFHTFHLAEAQNCPSPCVLGKDLMLKLTNSDYIGWNIRLNRMELGDDETLQFVNAISFANRLIDENAEKRRHEPLVARTMKDVVIPPRSDMVFTAELIGDAEPQTDYIIEEKPHSFTMKASAAADYVATPTQPNNDENYDPTDHVLTDIFEAPTDDWETQIQKLDLSRSVFNHRQKRRLLHVLRQHPHAFVQPNGRLGRYRGNVKHRIRLRPGTKPVSRRANRVPLALQNETRKQLEKLLKDELVRPSTSPFAAPVQHVPKKDGTFRMVCDYRGLNQQMEPQTYTMPNIQSIIDQCAGKKIFTSVDFSQAYHQTAIYEPDIHKSAFITEFGLYEWLVTPYGMANSGDTFSRMMQELAAQMSFRLLCFVDDIVLASDSADEHLDQLDEFLTVVGDHGLTLKLSKCTFGEAELPFLGMIISEHGVRPNPEKIAAIVNTPRPTTITAMKSLLGAVNYQRRYIPNCATVLRPLYEISSGERLGEWGPAQEEAFNTAKQLLTTAPILASPRIGVGYILETDVSKKGLGFVLLQPDKEGNNRVVAYGSRKTTKFEEKKDPCVLEAAAVRWSLEQCAPYLIGNPTTIVRTDNTAVKALLTKEDRNLNSQMNRYRLAIQGYDIRLEHRSGKTNKMADYLSRYVPEEATTPATPPAEELSQPTTGAGQINAITSEALRLTASRIRAEQRRESKLRQFYETLSGTKQSSKHAFTANDKTKLSKCSLRDGIVHYQAATDAAPRIWLPERLREQAVRELHEDPLAGGHLGTNKVEPKVRQRFYWPNMHEDVSAIVSSCPGCQYRKAPTKITPTEPLGKWPTPRWPFDRIHLDLYGVLPLTRKRHRYILTVADALTKWICAIPLKGQTAQEAHDAFLANVIAKYGVCSTAVTDQGTQFLCKAFDQLAALCGFRHRPVSAHHQASNGQIERFHKTLGDMLSSYVSTDPTTCDDYIASVTMAYNCSAHAITGQSPFWSLYGREANLPLDLRLTLFPEEQKRGQDGGIVENRGLDGAEADESEQNAAREQPERLRTLRRAWKDMKKAIEEKGLVRDAYRDERVRAKVHQLTEGQLVLKRKPADEIRSKFDYKFDGPYRLKSVHPPNVTIQKLSEYAKPMTLHVDDVKPFKAAITLPIYSNRRDAPLDDEGKGLDALMNGGHAEATSEEDTEAAAEDEVNTIRSARHTPHEVTAVRILPPSMHPIAINQNGYWKDVKGRARICALDLDGTIIKTRSGATFPKSKDDWQFWNDAVPEKLRRMHFCDFKLSVFSNQLGAGNGRVDLEAFKSKIEDICNAVAIPMQFFISTSEGFYRKPNVGMWRLLTESENDYEEVSNEHSFYVGDAAGRKANAGRAADHSNSDELFAANAGLSFFTPDAFFREKSYTKYTQERQEELDHLDGKRQSVRAIHAANRKAHEAYASGRDSENAGGGHSDDTTSPVSGEGLRRLMKLLDKLEEKHIRDGDAQLGDSGSDSDSGIDSTLIRTLVGASFCGSDLRRSKNLPHKVTLELEQETATQLREFIRSGPATLDRRTEAETEHRHRTADDRHTSP